MTEEDCTYDLPGKRIFILPWLETQWESSLDLNADRVR